jgi:hypothetical protein
MNRLVIGHGHHCFTVPSTYDDPLVGVGLLNDSVVNIIDRCCIRRIVAVMPSGFHNLFTNSAEP